MAEQSTAEELDNEEIDNDLEPGAEEEETRFDPPSADNDDLDLGEHDDDLGGDEFSDKASTMGWAPLDEWRGDPDKWVDAKTFVERGEQNNFMLRERNDKMFDEIKSMKETLGDLHKRNLEAEERGRQREHDRIMSTLDAGQREAVEEADLESFDAIQKKKDAAQAKFDDETEAAKPDKDDLPNDAAKVVNAWMDESPWYGKDQGLDMEAQGIHMRLQREKPHLSVAENLVEVSKEIKKRYPDQFGSDGDDDKGGDGNEGKKPPRKKHIQKSPSTVHNKGSNGKKGYNDLPVDARKQCDKYIKQIPGYTKEEYIKDYFGE